MRSLTWVAAALLTIGSSAAFGASSPAISLGGGYMSFGGEGKVLGASVEMDLMRERSVGLCPFYDYYRAEGNGFAGVNLHYRPGERHIYVGGGMGWTNNGSSIHAHYWFYNAFVGWNIRMSRKGRTFVQLKLYGIPNEPTDLGRALALQAGVTFW